MKPDLFLDTLLSLNNPPLQPLLENEVYNLIQKQIPEGYGELSDDEKADLIAFRFIEPKRNDTGKTYSYFKPLSVIKNDDGTTKEFPSADMISKETVLRWTERLQYLKHPVLLARYAGLICQFSHGATGSNATYEIIKIYIESLFAVIEQKLYKVPLYAITKVSRALEMAVALKNAELIERAKALVLALEKEIAIADKPGLWGFSFDLLLAGKKKFVSETEEADIINDLEEKFKTNLPTDSWSAECAAERLMNYYYQKKQIEDLKRILTDLEECYTNASQGRQTIEKVHYVEKLYHYYQQFKLNDEAEVYLKKLREISKETDKDLKSVSSKLDVPAEEIEKYVDRILTGNDYEIIFFRIVELFTPRIEEIKKEMEVSAKTTALQFMFARSIVDKKGRRVATIGPLTEDPEGHLISRVANSIRIGTMFLQFTFEEGNKRGIFTKHETMKFLKKSCIIDKDRYPIIEKGLDAYFSGDYTVSIHLLIPQFEEAIRNLVEMNGGNVMIEKNGYYNLKTFDHLLKDEIIKDVFGEDKAIYFRVLFTDNRGWNIRNDVAHGMLDNQHFLNKQNIDCILHAVLCLGMIRLQEKGKG